MGRRGGEASRRAKGPRRRRALPARQKAARWYTNRKCYQEGGEQGIDGHRCTQIHTHTRTYTAPHRNDIGHLRSEARELFQGLCGRMNGEVGWLRRGGGWIPGHNAGCVYLLPSGN